jgi:hydroxymethylbilane synthase
VSARATLRLGTRGSELARTQSATVAAALERVGMKCELTIIKTSGDANTTSTFASIGPQGVFVREIEQALVERRIELAVHSFKDLPTRSPPELVIAAVPARVEHFRPDLAVEPLRGNVPTRVRRLEQGHFDAIVLAAAGVERLQAEPHFRTALAEVVIVRLDPKRFVPAPAQGALAVQCRRDNARVLDALAAIDDAPARAAVTAERDALARAEGGCDVAFGAYCVASGRKHELIAMLERGGAVHTARVEGVDLHSLGAAVWTKLEAAVRP